jgi:hypothetical protein
VIEEMRHFIVVCRIRQNRSPLFAMSHHPFQKSNSNASSGGDSRHSHEVGGAHKQTRRGRSQPPIARRRVGNNGGLADGNQRSSGQRSSDTTTDDFAQFVRQGSLSTGTKESDALDVQLSLDEVESIRPLLSPPRRTSGMNRPESFIHLTQPGHLLTSHRPLDHTYHPGVQLPSRQGLGASPQELFGTSSLHPLENFVEDYGESSPVRRRASVNSSQEVTSPLLEAHTLTSNARSSPFVAVALAKLHAVLPEYCSCISKPTISQGRQACAILDTSVATATAPLSPHTIGSMPTAMRPAISTLSALLSPPRYVNAPTARGISLSQPVSPVLRWFTTHLPLPKSHSTNETVRSPQLPFLSTFPEETDDTATQQDLARSQVIAPAFQSFQSKQGHPGMPLKPFSSSPSLLATAARALEGEWDYWISSFLLLATAETIYHNVLWVSPSLWRLREIGGGGNVASAAREHSADKPLVHSTSPPNDTNMGRILSGLSFAARLVSAAPSHAEPSKVVVSGDTSPDPASDDEYDGVMIDDDDKASDSSTEGNDGVTLVSKVDALRGLYERIHSDLRHTRSVLLESFSVPKQPPSRGATSTAGDRLFQQESRTPSSASPEPRSGSPVTGREQSTSAPVSPRLPLLESPLYEEPGAFDEKGSPTQAPTDVGPRRLVSRPTENHVRAMSVASTIDGLLFLCSVRCQILDVLLSIWGTELPNSPPEPSKVKPKEMSDLVLARAIFSILLDEAKVKLATTPSNDFKPILDLLVKELQLWLVTVHTVSSLERCQ